MMTMMRWSQALAIAAALVLLGAAPSACAREKADKAKDGFGELTLDQVEQAIAKKEVVVIDNNSRERWQEGHLPTAKWVASSELKASDLPADKGQKVVFYCASPR